MKRFKRLIKHFTVPHRGNAFRPHALRHKALSLYLVALIVAQVAFGITMYSGPAVLGSDTEAFVNNVITLSNQEREEVGAGALYENEVLSYAAEQKLNDMFEKGYWDHVGPNGETAWSFIENEGYQYDIAGENLARGFSNSETVVSAWMNSPTHRDNILNSRFQEIGVAMGTGEVKGANTTVIVQLFGKPRTAFAAEQYEEAPTKLMPEFDIENVTQSSKTPYFLLWGMIFGLIVLDGIMLRKLGLHTSPKHMYSFRVSLLISVVMLALLSVSVAAIA